jgi:hypothetical protein
MIVQSILIIENASWYACSTRVPRVRCGVSPHRVARKNVRSPEFAGASTEFQAGRLKQPARRGCYTMSFNLGQ